MNGAFIKSWSTLRGVDTSWQISGIGDRDADGKSDLIWWNSKTDEMSCWFMNGAVLKGWTPMVPDSNWLQTVVAGPLELSEFSVILIEGREFIYIPVGRLREITGTSGITITSMNFHLNGIGASGNVPPLRFHRSIPAGGSADLNPPVYGDYSFEISGSTYSSSFTISISFIDDAGREGTLTATATVSRQAPPVIDNSWQSQ
jgi:hypothetical protein